MRDEPRRDGMGILLPTHEQMEYRKRVHVERLVANAMYCAETSKTIFKTPSAARSMCRTIRRRSGERLHPYRCEHCRKWHVGHGRSR